jgi:1-acyl-sn-glycerol-3-phosphate acyltransferase
MLRVFALTHETVGSMATARETPPISAGILRFFRRIVRSYFRRHFRAVLAQQAAIVEQLAQMRGPLIVYANHSSWWDPMVSVLLAEQMFPNRKHYAPMDAAALAKYPVLRRIGIFPVEMNSARGAAQFLRTSQAILAEGGVLWITPQGRFADPREPLEFKPGLAALAVRVPDVTLLPMAIEYAFWDERLPETLLRFGTPLKIEAGSSTEDASETLKASLAVVMQELQAVVVARDASVFSVLLQGGRGTGGFYAFGRRLRALFTGKKFVKDHTEREGIRLGEKE